MMVREIIEVTGKSAQVIRVTLSKMRQKGLLEYVKEPVNECKD
jgi:hypothetical protein